MIYDFDQVPERRDSDCVKWRAYDSDVLPLWVADMDFVSPQPVIQALECRVREGIFGYPQDLPELSEVFAARLKQRYGWEVQTDWLVWIPGVVTGFNLAAHTFAGPGGNVLVQPPVYTPMLKAPANAGLERREALLTRLGDGRYAVDMQAFEAAITPETRMFLLCNPHNPVGRVFREDELQQMAEICLRHHVPICSDEIHCELLFSGQRHIPIASLSPEIAAQTITLMAPSKTFNLAGLQCSVAIIPNPELKRRFQSARQGLVPWVNLMGQVAALAAYKDGQEWLDQLLLYLEGNRDFLHRYVRAELPGIQMDLPEGTYLAWLDCREAGLPQDPHTFFLEKARVALNDGATFGRGGEGFVRLNFGCPRATLEEALGRMKAALP